MPEAPDPSDDVAVVLAVKALVDAKSRLSGEFVSAAGRSDLVEAMFADTLDAVHAAGLTRIVVVSPDARVHLRASDFGAVPVDEPGAAAAGPRGLNAALRHGAEAALQRWSPPRIAYLQADLPALRPASLIEALDAARAHSAAFVADRLGTGTALLVTATSPHGPGLAPSFGSDSALAHRRSGAVPLDPAATRWPDLRADVDTADDLRHATTLGLGSHSRAARD